MRHNIARTTTNNNAESYNAALSTLMPHEHPTV
jgi:hypothetical protein